MVIHFAVAAFTTRRLLSRVCPSCGHAQAVAPSAAQQAVTCERCTGRIPPKLENAA